MVQMDQLMPKRTPAPLGFHLQVNSAALLPVLLPVGIPHPNRKRQTCGGEGLQSWDDGEGGVIRLIGCRRPSDAAQPQPRGLRWRRIDLAVCLPVSLGPPLFPRRFLSLPFISRAFLPLLFIWLITPSLRLPPSPSLPPAACCRRRRSLASGLISGFHRRGSESGL